MKPRAETKTRMAAKRRHVHEAEGVAGGAVAGAMMGAIAGPPGIAAGAVVGSVVGALAASALDRKAADDARLDEELDETIGVEDGDLGAPNLKHPPARVGAYSIASSGGAGCGDDAPAEGPMPFPLVHTK